MTDSSSPTKRPGSRSGFERVALAQVFVLFLIAAWGLGGNAPLPRLLLQLWGTLGMGLTATATLMPSVRRGISARALRWLWPFGLLNLLVLASLLHPGFRPVSFAGETMLAPVGGSALLPEAARPRDSLGALWLFDGTYLSCFNLALLVRRRRYLRTLLLLVAVNGLLLSILGSVQKLSGATGPFFGAVEVPPGSFFATFIYHNHWGAFALLLVAVSLGLVLREARKPHPLGFWNSPGFAGIVAVFLIALSIPLSLSRSCTVLVTGLLGAAGLSEAVRLVRRRRAEGASLAAPLAGAVLAVAVAAAAAFVIARPYLVQRLEKTREQVAVMRTEGGIGSRATLYRDTWRMAMDRPAFGWGLASYPTVFMLYNTQQSRADRLPVFYRDAHSDWLQALAEVGFVGTILLGLHGLLPLLSLRWRHLRSPVPVWLLAGCAVVLAYAWIEFPFGNAGVAILWWLCFFTAIRYARLESPA